MLFHQKISLHIGAYSNIKHVVVTIKDCYCSHVTAMCKLNIYFFNFQFFIGPAESLDIIDFVTIAYPRIKPFIMMEKGLFQPPTTEPVSIAVYN